MYILISGHRFVSVTLMKTDERKQLNISDEE